MRIAVPVDENNENTGVSVSFGRAPYYMVFDTDTQKAEFVVNTAAESAGGAGIMAAQIIVNQKSNVVLTERCGKNAAEILIAGAVKIYRSEAGSAMENVKAFIQGSLSELKEIHAGYHGHGG